MLLATSSHFSLAHLKAVNVASLRLAGEGTGQGIGCKNETTACWTGTVSVLKDEEHQCS